MIEGSGSIPLTSGSGSSKPKKIRIWMRNTGFQVSRLTYYLSSLASDLNNEVGCLHPPDPDLPALAGQVAEVGLYLGTVQEF